MSVIVRTLLAVAGAAALGIGLSLLFDPVAFEASAGIRLARDAALLSELRAPGAALAASGVYMLNGALSARATRAALALTAALYTAYGLARLVGVALDGWPGAVLVAAALVELLIGAAAVALSVTWKERHRARS